MKTNSVKAISDAVLSSAKKIDSEKFTKELAEKIANSFSGVEEKIGKNGSKKILAALDGLAAQGKSVITSIPTSDFSDIVTKTLKSAK